MPFNYFERFIAFRYLVPLRKGGLLSVISWLSFIGICIGVATLIIVMSVMNGFHDELKKRIIGFNGHIYIKNIEPYFENDQSLSEIKEILFIDRNISIQALISSANKSNGIVIKSINDENIKFYEIIDNLNKGKNVLFDIDWQGTQQLSKHKELKLTKIFILPPSKEELKNMLGIFS